MHGHARAGVYCQDVAHYMQIGSEGITFEGKAIKVALVNLI